ncbi:CGNR zinc finger domain-containing protein [Arthrobacter sp. ATA002]|uniref:CGNR zinc finger domain-containing protein n=1 Tax=Arthrobacter sp. ATA002 TaxID=2991715 RepID=UPI0022A75289|nr:CGNR zinc finger domain-containing protein [Arthrobacter sp. ATA002]WAP52034.1 CGNR zinc finger domain-containing protein [Arthrobacter sp. ATA002]
MTFTHDTEVALKTLAAFINTGIGTRPDRADGLLTTGDLDDFLAEQRFSGPRTRTAGELRAVRHLRTRLQRLWTADEEQVADGVNQLLRNARALPRVVRHDGWSWHLHCTSAAAPLEDRMATEAAMALADALRGGELDRLRACASPDCSAVLLDLTRNRSKRYCDTGNCANREHVRSYRTRQATRQKPAG